MAWVSLRRPCGHLSADHEDIANRAACGGGRELILDLGTSCELASGLDGAIARIRQDGRVWVLP